MATKIVTKSGSGAPATTDLVAGELAVDLTNKRLYTENGSAAIIELGTNPSGDVTFGDNGKAIFGAGSDLQIYHDGGHSRIEEVGTGDLTIRASSTLFLQSATNENYLKGVADGAVTAYYNNAAKLATTATGIDVTGDITLGDSNPTITFEDGSVTNLSHTVSSASDNLRLAVDVNGVDAGSRVEIFDGSTEVARFSAGAVDVTGTVTADGLTVNSGTTNTVATFESTDSTLVIPLIDSVGSTQIRSIDGSFAIRTGGDGGSSANTIESMRIDASGNVGIGTSSPTAKAHIVGAANAIALKVANSAVDGNTADVVHIEPSNGAYVGKLLRIQSGRSDFSDSLLFLNTTAGINGTNGSYMRVQNQVGADIFRIKGDGNVGIGTSSPSAKLHVDNGSGSALYVGLANNIYSRGTEHIWQSLNNASEYMRIDASGNVGIGTASPISLLTVNNNGEAFITIRSSDTGNAGIQFGDQSDSVQGAIYQNATDNSLRFNGYNNAESMRIDSSGNLLVGKTVLGTSVVGVEARANGLLLASRSGGEALILDRKTSDGTIVDLRKDGTTVGSIGVSGTRLTVGSGTSAAGIRFDGAGWIPLVSGAASDNAVDIGWDDSRIRNVYIGGGVYLGGTGAANKLEDYEEGTWDIVVTDLTNNATLNASYNTGVYTKVGRLVTLTGRFIMSSKGSLTGRIYISGIPFNGIGGNSYASGGFVCGKADGLAITAGNSIGGEISSNATSISLVLWNSADGSNYMDATNLDATADMSFAITYMAV